VDHHRVGRAHRLTHPISPSPLKSPSCLAIDSPQSVEKFRFEPARD
jgi:hypothetical protein